MCIRDSRYSGAPVPTLFALDSSDRVLSVESFSKVVAPGLRLGWVTAHPQLIAAMAAVRDDLGASQWMSQLMAAYLEEGLLDPHIQTVVSLYRDKRNAAVTALEKHCGDSVRFRTPEGGIYLWLKLDDSIDGVAVKEAARRRGIACRPGERFFGDGANGAQHLRLSFIMVPVEVIPTGVAVLGDAIASAK